MTCERKLKKCHCNSFSHQGNNVAEHVEAVSYEGHAVGEVADDELDQHEGGGHPEHPQQPRLGSAPSAAECLGKLHPTYEKAGDFPSLKKRSPILAPSQLPKLSQKVILRH